MNTTVLSLGVVVFGNPGSPSTDPRDALAERLDAEVIPKSPTELSIEQERLSFDVAPPLEIHRAYPQHHDIDRLAQAANVWIDLVADPDSVNSILYRIELTCSPEWSDDTLRVLGRRLLAPNLPFPSWEVDGGTASIAYRDKQDRMWNFTIQPRVPDTTKLFLITSLHIGADPNLAIEEVARSLQDVWDTSLLFLQEVSGD